MYPEVAPRVELPASLKAPSSPGLSGGETDTKSPPEILFGSAVGGHVCAILGGLSVGCAMCGAFIMACFHISGHRRVDLRDATRCLEVPGGAQRSARNGFINQAVLTRTIRIKFGSSNSEHCWHRSRALQKHWSFLYPQAVSLKNIDPSSGNSPDK